MRSPSAMWSDSARSPVGPAAPRAADQRRGSQVSTLPMPKVRARQPLHIRRIAEGRDKPAARHDGHVVVSTRVPRRAGRRTNLALLVVLPAAFVTGWLAFGTGTFWPARVVTVT